MLHHKVRRFRERGRLLPRADFNNQRPSVGELVIYETTDKVRNRTVRVAELKALGVVLYDDTRPKLYEPQLIAYSARVFSLSGFERVGEFEYAQSWHCTLIK